MVLLPDPMASERAGTIVLSTDAVAEGSSGLRVVSSQLFRSAVVGLEPAQLPGAR